MRSTFRALVLASVTISLVGSLMTIPLSVTPDVHAMSTAGTVGSWQVLSAAGASPVPAVNMVVLNDGKVLIWDGVDANEEQAPGDPVGNLPFFYADPNPSEARVVDISGSTATFSVPSGDMDDLFCSGQTVLPDGNVLTAGGSEWKDLYDAAAAPTDPMEYPPVLGLRDASLFSPTSAGWTDTDPMTQRRWYPSVITLGDGRALVASGIEHLALPQTQALSVEVYDPAAASGSKWTTLGTSVASNIPLYPRLYVVPSGPNAGDVFYTPVGCLWCPFGERPDEALWSAAQMLDVSTGAWTSVGGSLFGMRQHAAAPMLTLEGPGYEGKILTFGGTIYRSTRATSAAEIVSTSNPLLRTLADPMNDGRWHLNGVLLPDGKVAAVGGTHFDTVTAYSMDHDVSPEYVLEAELYDPAGASDVPGAVGSWIAGASATVPRGYHSTAALLPDGRVLVGGHVPLPALQDPGAQTNELRLEVYSPPYLFNADGSAATRPTITSVPATPVAHGDAFPVDTPDAADIDRAVLIRPGATTHSYDADARGIVVSFTQADADTLTVTAPPSGNVAPPGWYMLFLLEDGVPSVAKFVRLG